MGNHMACTCSPRTSHGPTGIQVLNADTGHISHYPLPSSSLLTLQAGEIMMEHPSHYLCRLADLEIGRRIAPIPADNVLEPDHPYVLLPMYTLHSKISQEDLAFLSSASSLRLAGAKSVPNKRARSRILPLMSPSSLLSALLSPLSSSHHRPAQLGLAEEAIMPVYQPGIEVKLCRTLLFRSQSFAKGEDMVANGEDLLGQALRMRRTMSWIPKLEPIGESESEQLSNEKGMSRPNSSIVRSRMGGCIAWSGPQCSE